MAIQTLRPVHSLPRLLVAAEMPRSTFYYRTKKPHDKPTPLAARVFEIYHEHKGRYGYRRIAQTLRNEGALVNHKAVQRVMQELNIKSLVRPKKYRSYRGETHVAVPNVLARAFKASAPKQKWVTDVTEFRVGDDKLYLSTLMDLYNREIVSYSMAGRPTFKLVSTMLDEALAHVSCDDGLLIHSDQGWHYHMAGYREKLSAHGVTQSMSRRGNCLDNAAMESFFGTLKSELFFRLNQFTSIQVLETAIREYVGYYNHERIHSKLKGRSPVSYRTQAFPV